jgi:exoribonuclease R
MTERYLDQAIKYLAGATKPLKIRELARKLSIKQAEYRDFRRIIKNAISEGKISRGKGGKLALPGDEDFLSGKLFVSRAGYGFVITKTETGDIFISKNDMGGAIHGEQVEVILKSSESASNRSPHSWKNRIKQSPKSPGQKKYDCQRQAISLGGSVSSTPRAYRGVAGYGGGARDRYRFPYHLTWLNSGI